MVGSIINLITPTSSQSRSKSKSKSPPKPKSKSPPKPKSKSTSKSPPKPKSESRSRSRSKSPPNIKESQRLLESIKKINKQDQFLAFAKKQNISVINEDDDIDFFDLNVKEIVLVNKEMKAILSSSLKKLNQDELANVVTIFEALPDSVMKKMLNFATRQKFVTLDENNEPELDMESLNSFQLHTLVTYAIKALGREIRLKKSEEDAKTFLIQATQIMERRKLFTEKPDTLMNAELFESLFANGDKYEGDEIMRKASKGRYYVTRQDIDEKEIPFCFAFTLNNGQEVVLEGFFNNFGGLNNRENQKYTFPLNKKDQENDSSLGMFHKLIVRQGQDENDVTDKSVYELKAIGSDKGKNLNKPDPMKILIHFPLKEKVKGESSPLVTLSCNIFVDLNIAKVSLFSFRPIAYFQNPEVVLGKGQECKRSEKKSERQTKKNLEKQVVKATETEEERKTRNDKQKRRNKYLRDLWDDKVMKVNRQYTSEEEKDYVKMLKKHEAKQKRTKKEVELKEQALKNKIFTENEFVNINEQLSEKNQDVLARFAYDKNLASERGEFFSTWDEMSQKDKLQLSKLASDLLFDQKQEEKNEKKRRRRRMGKEDKEEEEEEEEEEDLSSSDSDYS
jgi:hypothetical protein